MYITKDVDIPDEILEANEEGKLVIFAGAGVSVDSPASLPNFSKLADEIANKCREKRKRKESIDEFLGRLQNNNVDVKEMVKEILQNPESKPNKLHKGIVNIFKTPKQLKIITTNFDSHFSACIKEKYQDDVETYYAPVLPLGNDFTGLVYLHGSINKNIRHMVLTDSDFGKAYLTLGWTTRFIRAVFATYTVLFIGYSFNDPIMKYFNRGLAFEAVDKYKLFTFSQKKESERWRQYHIIPIEYTKIKGRYPYFHIKNAIIKWSERNKLDIFSHERKIKIILTSPPSLDNDIKDYLNKVISSDRLVRFFIENANSKEWFQWFAEQDIAKELFALDDIKIKTLEKLSLWFAKNLIEYSDDGIYMIYKNKTIIKGLLWNEIAAVLLAKVNDSLAINQMGKWIEILLSTYTKSCDVYYLIELYKKNGENFNKNSNIILRLFQFFITPNLRLEQNFLPPSLLSSKIRENITFKCSEYELNEIWNILKKHIDSVYKELIVILTSQITGINLILKNFDSANAKFDSISFSRSAIEPDVQDEYAEAKDVVIDAGRDLIEWMANNKKDESLALINIWQGSTIPLLQRLSVYGMHKSIYIDCNKKLRWILENDLLYSFNSKHEIYQLLKDIFSNASKKVKEELLSKILDKNLQDRGEARCCYNLLYWLKNNGNDSDENINNNIKLIQKYFPNFRPSSHPDFNSYISSGYSSMPSPISIEDLKVKNPKEDAVFLEYLINYHDEGKYYRYGLLLNISKLVEKDFLWAKNIIDGLLSQKNYKSDIWQAIFENIGNALFDANQWNEILSRINADELISENICSIAFFLCSFGRNKKFHTKCVAKASILAKKVLSISLKNGDLNAEKNQYISIQDAINNLGGYIAGYLVCSLSYITHKNKIKRMPKFYSYMFQKIINNNSQQAKYGEIIIGENIYFLYRIDEEWTKDNIISSLVSKNNDVEIALWTGYIFYGQWDEKLLDILLPLLEKAYTCILKDEILRRKLYEFLAMISIYSSRDDIDKILNDFDKKTNFTKDSALLLQNICIRLKKLQDNQIKDIWQRWLRKYIRTKTLCIPREMQESEIKELIELLPYLGSIFPEAVKFILKLKAVKMLPGIFYKTIDEKNLASKYPDEVTDILIKVLKEEDKIYGQKTNIKHMIDVISRKNIDRAKLRKLKEEAYCLEIAKSRSPASCK